MRSLGLLALTCRLVFCGDLTFVAGCSLVLGLVGGCFDSVQRWCDFPTAFFLCLCACGRVCVRVCFLCGVTERKTAYVLCAPGPAPGTTLHSRMSPSLGSLVIYTRGRGRGQGVCQVLCDDIYLTCHNTRALCGWGTRTKMPLAHLRTA